MRNKLKKQILEDLDEARTEFDEIDDLTDDIIELYDLEHKKRNDSQYVLGYEVKASKAGTSLERAKQFVYELEKLIIE